MNLATPEDLAAPRAARAWRAAACAAALYACAIAPAFAQDVAPATRPAATAEAQPREGGSILRAAPRDGMIRLMANRSTVLKTRVPFKNVSISQPEVADINLVGPNDILLTAKKPGTTQLIIWDDEDRSEVIEVAVESDLNALQAQMDKMFPGSRIEVTGLNGSIALRGRVPSLQVAEQALEVAGPFAQKVMNFLEVSGGQQVMLQIRFAEVSRSASSNLGFNLFGTDGTSNFGTNNGPGGSGTVPTAVGAGVTVFGSGAVSQTTFDYFISAMRRNNLLRVLAEPNLVVYSGARGSFLAGGEFPYPVPQSSSGDGISAAITVEFKKFGVQLDFTPVVLGDGRIRLKVTPEVSDLDYSRSITSGGIVIPSITKRTLTTEIELAEGQTFAVAGLLNNRVQANKDVTPLLGDIPVLGALFRSVRYERNETELVVLVTPRLVEPMNPDQVPALPGENWRHPSEVETLLNGDLGGPAKGSGAKGPGRPARYRGEYGFTPAK